MSTLPLPPPTSSLLSARPALALGVAGVALAYMVAVGPGHVPGFTALPIGWYSIPLVLVLAVYLGSTAAAIVVHAVAPVLRWGAQRTRSNGPGTPGASPPTAERPARSGRAAHRPFACDDTESLGGASRAQPAQPRRWRRERLTNAGVWWTQDRRHALAAAVFAVVVALEGVAHQGAASGPIATSRPLFDADEASADGFAIWVEGQPVLSESLYTWQQVDALSRRAPSAGVDFVQDMAGVRTGHAAYAFFVALAARLTTPFGSVLAGYVIVNLLFWWAGAMATYDLARRAAGSWPAGVIAGLLTATGIGFTWMAGVPYSGCAAYGAVAMVLWLIDRVRVFDDDTPVRHLILVCLVACATSLLYGLVPLLAGFAVLAYFWRSDWRRLLVWTCFLFGGGQAWAQVTFMASGGWAHYDPSSVSRPALTAGVLTGMAAACWTMFRLRRSQSDRLIAMLAGAMLGASALTYAIAPGVLVTGLNTITASAQVPRYLGDLGQLAGRSIAPFAVPLQHLAEPLRLTFVDLHVEAAFPGTVAALAALGFVRLPRRWADWCCALLGIVTLQMLVMNTVSGAPHPRLMYFAFPAVYVLAGNGTALLGGWMQAGVQAMLRRPSRIPVAAGLLTAAAVLTPVVLASNAVLWGDLTYDAAFHYLNVRNIR
jgi:hypothetical protein